jgi:hypothetical protein
MGFLESGMHSMNFVDLFIRFPVEVSEESPNADSDIAPEERPNHPHLEEMRVVLYNRPNGIVVGKQAGTAQDAVRKASETIERHVSQELEKGKKHFRPPALPDVQADDLEDMGILVGEVCDEKITEDSLHQGENPINESLVTSNQYKKGC